MKRCQVGTFFYLQLLEIFKHYYIIYRGRFDKIMECVMKYSRTAIKVLKAQYLSILKKCVLINAGLFIGLAFGGEAVAAKTAEVSSGQDFYTAVADSDVSRINLTNDIILEEDLDSRHDDLKINGNGYSIDGNGYAGFDLSGGSTLEISNISKISGFLSDRKGGVFANSGTLSISNSTFTNNATASGQSGGVLYNRGTVNDINITAYQNSGYDGAVIYNDSTIYNINGIYINNTADKSAGVLYNDGRVYSLSGIFMDNTATNGAGGVIYNDARGSMLHIVADKTDTIFSDNKANGKYNAIQNDRGTIHLNAGQGKLIFNDSIINVNTVNLEVNKDNVKIDKDGNFAPTFGTVYLNDKISGDPAFSPNIKLNLYNGTLKLGSYKHQDGTVTYGNFDKYVDFKAKGGTLDIGTNQVCSRSASFEKNSTLAVTVNSLTEYGTFTADKFAIEEGAKIQATLGQGIIQTNVPQTITLLSQTSGSFDDNFTPINQNNMYGLKKGDNAGEYIITQLKTASDVSQAAGGSANNTGTANAWVDGNRFAAGSAAGELADKLAALAQNDAYNFNRALSALAPEVSPIAKTAAIDHSSQVFNAVSTRMSGGAISSSASGKSSGDEVFDNGATWVQLLANKSKFDGTRKAHGFDSKAAGVAFGAEKQINQDVKAGAGYAYTNGEIDAYMRDVDVDTHTVFAYGEYKLNNWFVNGAVSYSFSDYDESKNVLGSHYKADYDVKMLGVQLMSGYDFHPALANITPFGGLRYNHMHRSSYHDTANQDVAADNMEILTTVAGVKIGKDFTTCEGTLWRPEVRAAMTYDVISDKENAVVSLLNGSGYLVEGERLKRLGFEAGLGVTLEVSNKIEAAVGYEGRFREDYTDHTGLISAKYKF